MWVGVHPIPDCRPKHRSQNRQHSRYFKYLIIHSKIKYMLQKNGIKCSNLNMLVDILISSCILELSIFCLFLLSPLISPASLRYIFFHLNFNKEMIGKKWKLRTCAIQKNKMKIRTQNWSKSRVACNCFHYVLFNNYVKN